jgi:hypothetical protein
LLTSMARHQFYPAIDTLTILLAIDIQIKATIRHFCVIIQAPMIVGFQPST